MSGWEQIGSGFFSYVYKHPDSPGTVLKLGRHYEHVEDGWLSYALSCTRTRSPHAPKIHAIEIHKGYYFAEIEELRKMDMSSYYDLGVYKHGRTDEDCPPSLRAFIRRTEKLRAHYGYEPDYHDKNFMVRPSDGTVVCIDPWC